jgi:hypothetical protein
LPRREQRTPNHTILSQAFPGEMENKLVTPGENVKWYIKQHVYFKFYNISMRLEVRNDYEIFRDP